MNNQNHSKFLFHIHHEEELLHLDFISIEGPVGLYFFEKGILVEIHVSNKEQYQKNYECNYNLSKGKSSKYIFECEKGTKKKEQKNKFEILQRKFFTSFDEFFGYQKNDTWSVIDQLVVFFGNHQEAFPFIEHILQSRDHNISSSHKPRISNFFVGDGSYLVQNDPKIHRNFVLLIENPDVFLCLRLQKYFENTVDIKLESQPSDIAENKVRGMYESYTSKHGTFYIPLQCHHSLLHCVCPTEDVSVDVYNTHVFYPKSIHKSLCVTLRLREIDEFISYHVPQKVNLNVHHDSDSNVLHLGIDSSAVHKNDSIEMEAKISIEVRTRKTRQEQPVVAWFFEDIELKDLQNHLSYITDEEIETKRLQYIIAQESLNKESTNSDINIIGKNVDVLSSTDKNLDSDSENQKRTHVLMFSLDGVGFRHPTFHKIGIPLQKTFEGQNLFINTDEVFCPQITESTSQKLFALYREEHFACVFLGERTFLFPKNMYPLNRITQHVLNHQKIRLDAFIDRCMWDLQSWVNLPIIPRDLQSSRRGNISTASSTKKRIQDIPKAEGQEEIQKTSNTTESIPDDNLEIDVDGTSTELGNSQLISGKDESNTSLLAKEELLQNQISNILDNPTIQEERTSYEVLYRYLQDRMSYAPSDVWQTRLLKKNPFQAIQSDLILTAIICLYLQSPNTSRIIDDLDEIYLQLDHKKPVFLDILTSKKVTNFELVRQQEFLSDFMSLHRETTVEHSSVDEVLNLNDNIFVHLLCWKLWLPQSKNIRLWNQVRPKILKQAKLILQNRVYPQQIHNLLSMRHVPVDVSEKGTNTIKANTENLNEVSHSLHKNNYISKRNIEDFFTVIETAIQSLSSRVHLYGYLFFSIYAPDDTSHVHQQSFWNKAQPLIDSQPEIIQRFLQQAHLQSLEQLKNKEILHQVKSPMLDALDFLQKLFEQSIEENFDFVLNEIFLKRASTFNQYQDIFSNISHENNEMIYFRIRSYVEENFLSGNSELVSEYFFILYRDMISSSLRMETLNMHKYQSRLKQTLFDLIDIALEKPDIKKIRTSLWVMLTLLKGTSDITIDFGCLQKFQQIQESLSKYIEHLPNPRHFGTMQRYQVAIIYLACIQFLPFEKRLDFICHCNALLNKEAKEIHMFRHFYLMSVALFSDQFLKNHIKEKFIIREYMRIVKHIQSIDLCLSE